MRQVHAVFSVRPHDLRITIHLKNHTLIPNHTKLTWFYQLLASVINISCRQLSYKRKIYIVIFRKNGEIFLDLFISFSSNFSIHAMTSMFRLAGCIIHRFPYAIHMVISCAEWPSGNQIPPDQKTAIIFFQELWLR